MPIDLTTPTILFPTISLLLLAYTNRFIALAAIIRNLHATHKSQPDPMLRKEIANLRYRVRLIRDMQAIGALSLLLCVVCILLLFVGLETLGRAVFAVSLILMMVSLALSFREIQVSTRALNLHLRDLEASGAADRGVVSEVVE
jgi:Zn-dependent membrane protease YugP